MLCIDVSDTLGCTTQIKQLQQRQQEEQQVQLLKSQLADGNTVQHDYIADFGEILPANSADAATVTADASAAAAPRSAAAPASAVWSAFFDLSAPHFTTPVYQKNRACFRTRNPQQISVSQGSLQGRSDVVILMRRVSCCCSVLQCVAVCCSVLQCVAVRCSVLSF